MLKQIYNGYIFTVCNIVKVHVMSNNISIFFTNAGRFGNRDG